MKLFSLEWEDEQARSREVATGGTSRLLRLAEPAPPRWKRALASMLSLSIGAGLLLGLTGAPSELKLVAGRNFELTSGGVSGTLSPYTPGELWGGGSEVENCSVCSPSGLLGKSGGQSTEPNQPVDPMTGGYTDSESLFSAGAVGGDLSMSMTYDSGLATAQMVNAAPAGYFGYGWKSTLSGSGASGPGNTFTFTDENTAQTTFTQLSSNDSCPVGDYADFQKYTVPGSAYGYCAANRVDAQLGIFPAVGAYEVERSGGKVIDTYDAYGRLAYIATNATTSLEPLNFTYNVAPGSITQCPAEGESSCFMESDQSGSGRTVTAEVDGYGLVQKIYDPLGRQYVINYTDGDGDMNQIEKPSPAPGGGWATTSLLYTTTATSPYNRDLTRVTDPVGAQTNITYSGTGMVYQTADPLGNVDTYTYTYNDCALPTSGDCTGLGWIQTTNVTYSDGEVDKDFYTSGILTQDSWGTSAGPETWTFGYAEPTSADQDAATVETVGLPGGPTATIDTDSTGNVVSYTDPNGNTTTSMYNDSGGNDLDELCWTAPAGTYIAYNASCANPPLGATTHAYDAYGDQTSQTDPLGNTTRSGYYANGLLCWTAPPTITVAGSACSGYGTGGPGSASPAGSTTYAYDLLGDVTNKTVAAAPSPAQTTTSQYNNDDELLYTIPPNGQGQGTFGSNAFETSFSYEPDGSSASVAAPLSRVTSHTYDAAGNVLTTSDPAGVTTNSYEGDHRLCWSYRSTAAYGSNACLSPPSTGATIYPSGYHGETNAPNAVEDPDGQTTTYAYGDARFPAKATQVTEPTVSGNPQPNIMTYSSYDNFGDTCMSGPVSTGAAGTCAQLAGDTIDLYNAEGQLNGSYNPDGQETTYAYSNADFPTDATAVTNPLSKTTQYSYDVDGRLTSAMDPAGTTVTTGYDADSRPCFEAPVATSANCTSPPTGSGVTVLTYDQASQRVGMSDNFNNGGSGQINDAYSFDADGNLLSSSNDNGQTNTYAYNQDNQDTCISYVATVGSTCSGTPSGSYVTRGYNSAGELASTTDWLSNTVTYTNYNALSEVQTISFPSATGESLSYSYDPDGNVTGLLYNGTLISGLSGSDSWTPNADNQVGASSSIHSYASPSDTYDSYDRVRQATNPTTIGSQSGPDTYTYNNDGDLTDDAPPGGSQVNYSYNNGDQLTSIANPNNSPSTQDDSLNYTADGQRCWSNWASSVTTQSCGSAPSGATQYAWNTYGQLCGSGTTSGAASCGTTGSGYTGYTYDGNNIRMSSTTNSVTTKFDWDGVSGGTIPLDISDGTNAYVYGPLLFGGTAPIEQISLGTTPKASFLASTQAGVQAVFGTNTSTTSAADHFTYVSGSTPVVTAVSPAAGSTSGGTSTTITGANFTGATAVKFGSTNATSYTVNSSSQITATVPAQSPATIAPVQNSSSESVSGSTETVTLSSNVTAGNALVLNYANPHDGVTVSSVSGGGVTWAKADQENDSANTADTEIWYGLNSSGGSGTSTITVTLSGTAGVTYGINVSEWSGIGALDQTPAGIVNESGSSTASAPSITPTKANELFIGAVGANWSVSGSPGGGFTSLSHGSLTNAGFGRLVATDSSAHQFTQGLGQSAAWSGIAASFSPALTASTVDVSVTNGSGTSATSAADHFTYASGSTPVVTAVSPAAGSTSGGTSTTITGANFTGASAVKFGSTNATSYTVNSSSQITATAPAQPSATITPVQNSSSESVSGSTETVTLSSNVTAGNGLVLTFGNPHDGVTVSSVSGGGVTWSKADQENDSNTADTEVWYGLNASGGSGTSTIAVTLSGTAALAYGINVSEWSGIGVLDQTPAGTVNDSGSSTASAPSITPTKANELFIGAVGANWAVSGSPGGGFTSLSHGSLTNVGFARLVATDSSSHQFTQGLGQSAAWSGIAASFSPAFTASTVDITVTNASGTSTTSAADHFTYVNGSAPVVTAVSPAAGSTSGGTSAIITGANFSSVSQVYFGSIPATSFTINSANQITAVAPAGSSVVDVTVGTPALAEEMAYTAFGTPVLQSGSDVTPFGFQGSYTDPSGLIYLINRYYDPTTSQFLSIDPKVAETGHPYAYTADDPLNSTDPLGLGASPSKADLQWNAKYGCGLSHKRKCRSLGGSLVSGLDKVRHAGAAVANKIKHHPVAALTVVAGTALLAVPGAEPIGADLDAAAAPELGVSLTGSGSGYSAVRAFAGLGLIESEAQSCRSGSAGSCFSASVGVLALASPGLEPVALSISIANAFSEAR